MTDLKLFPHLIFKTDLNERTQIFNFFIVDTVDLRDCLLSCHSAILFPHITDGIKGTKAVADVRPIFVPRLEVFGTVCHSLRLLKGEVVNKVLGVAFNQIMALEFVGIVGNRLSGYRSSLRSHSCLFYFIGHCHKLFIVEEVIVEVPHLLEIRSAVKIQFGDTEDFERIGDLLDVKGHRIASSRFFIALDMACNPKIIIADEPTTALDVTIQAQILDLLRSLKDRINSSIMLITHDLGVIAEMADYVVVMYAGRVVEKGTVEEIFAHPSHPYTIGLMASKPVVGKKVDRLYSIPGKVPNPVDMPNYCYFKDRCELQLPCCSGEYPCEISLSPTHKVSCYRYYEENRKAGE